MKKPIFISILLIFMLCVCACSVQLPDDFSVEKTAVFDYDFKTEALDDFGHDRELPELSQDEYNKLYDSLKAMGFAMDSEADEYQSRYYFHNDNEFFVIDYMKEMTYLEGTDEEYTNPSYNMMAWYKSSSEYSDSAPDRNQILTFVRQIEKENEWFEIGFDCVIDVTSDFLYEQTGLKYVYVPSKNSYYPYAAQSYLVGSNGAVPLGIAGFNSPVYTPFLCDIDSDGEFEVIMITSAGSGIVNPVVIAYGVKDGAPYEKYNQTFDTAEPSAEALLSTEEFEVSKDGKSFSFTYENKSYKIYAKDGEMIITGE